MTKIKSQYLYILLIFLFVLLVIFYISSRIKGNDSSPKTGKEHFFDDIIPANTIFIPANESSNFSFKSQIIINGLPDEKQIYTSLAYNVEIVPKSDNVYKKCRATAFIDDSLKEFIAIKSFLTFGTDPSQKDLVMDKNSSDHKGIAIARSTWIEPAVNIHGEIFQEALRKGMRVKIGWDKGVEYVLIDSKNTEMIYK